MDALKAYHRTANVLRVGVYHLREVSYTGLYREFGVAVEHLLAAFPILQEPVALELIQRLRHRHVHAVEPIYGKVLTSGTISARVSALIVLEAARPCIVLGYAGQLIVPVLRGIDCN